jgi:hypothetical protein
VDDVAEKCVLASDELVEVLPVDVEEGWWKEELSARDSREHFLDGWSTSWSPATGDSVAAKSMSL